MSAPRQDQVRNRLLALMRPEDFACLAPHLEASRLGRGEVIAEPGATISSVYFLDSGVGSTVAVSKEGRQIEVGLFGRDGFSPLEPVFGSDRTINRTVIQLPDDSWRIDAALLAAELASRTSLRELLTRYAYVLTAQGHCTALSNIIHPVDQRLARWLLMCHDRVDGDKLALTHEFISIMLAVRRPTVTTALHLLEGDGFIRSERGCVVIRNRQALEEFAGEAYGKPEAEYRRLIGPMSD